MSRPRRVSRWFGRDVSRTAAAVVRGLLVVALVALVAWPERNAQDCVRCYLDLALAGCTAMPVEVEPLDASPPEPVCLHRDDSLAVLLPFLDR